MSHSSLLAVDHCVANTQDLEGSAEVLRRLGFVLSPRSDLDGVGVANHLILFEPHTSGCASFFEIMSPTRNASSLHPAMREVLQGPARLSWLVLASGDAKRSYAHVQAHGMHMPAPVRVKREWKIDGQSFWPEFDVTFPSQPDAQIVPFNLCQYHNVHLYHRSSWMQHANGARRLLAALAIVDDPEQSSRVYAQLWDAQSRMIAPGIWRVSLGQTSLDFLSAPAWKRRYPDHPVRQGLAGLRLQVQDVQSTAQYFKEHGVTVHADGDSAMSVQVNIEPRSGLVMEFCA